MTSVRDRDRDRRRAALFFRELSPQDRVNLGDQLVLGTFDWREWMERKPSASFLRVLDKERIGWEISSGRSSNLTSGQKAAIRARAGTGRMFIDDSAQDEDAVIEARPGFATRRPPPSEIPSGTPISRLPRGAAEGALPFDWPNPLMEVVANSGRQPNKSLARDVEELIREAEGHGCRVKAGRHWKIYCPGGMVVASKTPSDRRVLKKIRSDLRRAGVPLANKRQANRGSTKLKRPKLEDAQKMARAYPETFELPSKAAVAALGVGDFAKVDIPGERFWVVISKRDGSKFEGIIDNDLVATHLHGLTLGDRIAFQSKHLYDAVSKENMNRRMAMQLAANPLDLPRSSRRRSDDIPGLDSRIRRLKGHVESIDDIFDRGTPSTTERGALKADRERFRREIRALTDKITAIEHTIEREGDLIDAPPPSLWRTRTRNPFVGQQDRGVRTDLEIFSVAQLNAQPTLAIGHEDDLKHETSKNRWWLDRIEPESGADRCVTVEELDLDDGRWWPVHQYSR